MVAIYKYLNGLPLNMNAIFKLRPNIYNLRNFHTFEYQNFKTKKFNSSLPVHFRKL